MSATKTFLGIICGSMALMTWLVAHVVLWGWLIPSSGAWQAVGAVGTAVVLPSLIVCLFIDLTKQKGR